MKPETYFKKHGKIYGVSEKFEFGRWSGYALEFTDWDEAQKWLLTEEYDFRERSLCSKARANRYL